MTLFDDRLKEPLRLVIDRFVCGDADGAELFANATTQSERDFCHYYLGLQSLGHGDRRAAIDHFQQVVAVNFPQWGLLTATPRKDCAVLLHRLREDPTWPTWIPVTESEPDEQPAKRTAEAY